MYWFSRPPYLRWVAAALLLVAALYAEFRPTHTRGHPYLARNIPAGTVIGKEDLEWREVPIGLLAMPSLEDPVAGRPLIEGEPLLPSALATGPIIPVDWWAVPVPLPGTAIPGQPARVVVTDPLLTVEGIVLEAPRQDVFGFEATGLVAVPGPEASLVAASVGRNAVIVMLAP